MHNNALKKGFIYHPETDTFECAKGKHLGFHRLIYKQPNQSYYHLYSIPRPECAKYERLQRCAIDKGAIRINASGFYLTYYAGRQRCQTKEYQAMKRLRSIWSEGAFAALKNQHNLKRIRKRGILRANEECLLSAIALNLKRIVAAMGGFFCPVLDETRVWRLISIAAWNALLNRSKKTKYLCRNLDCYRY